VILPDEIKFKGKEVFVSKFGNGVMISPIKNDLNVKPKK
jgi:virulence-associated protein VagC